MNAFNRDLQWIQGTSHHGGFFYYFPDSMTLIEYDEDFGKLLGELKHSPDHRQAKHFPGYPEGYVEDVFFNLGILEKQGLLSEFAFPGIPQHIPIGRIIVANTMRCNLACRYCYNRFESNAAPRQDRDMSVETFRTVMRFLEESGADLPFYELFFIGGEPLLHAGILEEAEQWGKLLREKGKDLSIVATTNATLLDREMVDFCTRHQINLKLTLDGDREEHDKNRVFPGGEGSYDRIADNLPEFFAACNDSSRYVASTIDTQRSDPMERVAGLSARGFNVIDLTELYSPGEHAVSCSDEELEDSFREKYRRLFDFLFCKIRERDYLHLIPLFDIVKNLHLRKPAFMRCRAGGDSLAASPDGTLYACHHFFGDDRFALGTVFDGALPSLVLAPYRIPVGERSECKACWARLLCGGPCFHRSLAVTGDAFRSGRTECIRIKALILEAILFYLRLRNEDGTLPDWFVAQGMER
jgi:uncharacterized protein